MISAAPTTGFNRTTFDSFLSSRDEPGWLLDLRRDAWRVFAELPWPDSSFEEWRRTDVRLFRLDKYAPPPADECTSTDRQTLASGLPHALLAEGVDLAGRTAALNSRSLLSQLDPDLAKQGVLFGSLSRLAKQHGDLLKPHLLSRAVDPHYDKFAALHAAFWSGGTLLYVPRGVRIEKPLHIQTALLPNRDREGGAVFPSDFSHTLVILDEGAEATLMAETCSAGVREYGSAGVEDSAAHRSPSSPPLPRTPAPPHSSGLHCGAVELLVGPAAKLRYVNLQNWDKSVWHFAHHKALVERDAEIQWTIGALGARLAKVNQHVALVGEGASAQVNGVMFTEGKQHLNYHTLQHHEAGHCKSDFLYKGALQDESRLVWRGMIKVDKGADKTDGYQRNDNLMLSEHARADSIPGLEIEADDVRCTHGATAGRVDDESIFYLQSRGLTRNEAVRLVVAGFFQQVFDRITIDSVREALGQAIGRRIREYA